LILKKGGKKVKYKIISSIMLSFVLVIITLLIIFLLTTNWFVIKGETDYKSSYSYYKYENKNVELGLRKCKSDVEYSRSYGTNEYKYTSYYKSNSNRREKFQSCQVTFIINIVSISITGAFLIVGVHTIFTDIPPLILLVLGIIAAIGLIGAPIYFMIDFPKNLSRYFFYDGDEEGKIDINGLWGSDQISDGYVDFKATWYPSWGWYVYVVSGLLILGIDIELFRRYRKVAPFRKREKQLKTEQVVCPLLKHFRISDENTDIGGAKRSLPERNIDHSMYPPPAYFNKHAKPPNF